MLNLSFLQTMVVARWEPRVQKMIKSMTQQEYSDFRKAVGLDRTGLLNANYVLKETFRGFQERLFDARIVDLRKEGRDL